MASFFTFPHRWSPYPEMNLNLVGRETNLVGRETGAPQRIWDSSIFTGRVGRYNMCCYVSPREPLGPNSLPSVWWGQSLTLKHSTGFCLWLTHEQWLGSVKAWEACSQQHVLPSPPHGSAWTHPDCCLRAQCFLLPLQSSLKASNRKKKRTSFKRKASKRGTEVSSSKSPTQPGLSPFSSWKCLSFVFLSTFCFLFLFPELLTVREYFLC